MTRVDSQIDASRPAPRRLPWTAAAAALMAFGTLYITGSEPFVLIPLAVALVLTYPIRARLPENLWLRWCVRGGLYAAIILLNQEEFSGLQGGAAFTADRAGAFGQIYAAETVLQAWRRQPPERGANAAFVFWSTLVYLAAAMTDDSAIIRWTAPAYCLLLVLALPRFGPRRQTPPSLAGSVMRALLASVALVLGGAVYLALTSHATQLTAWGSQVLGEQQAAETTGVSADPEMGETFGLRGSTAQVLMVEGLSGPEHLRGLAFDTYQLGRWHPDRYERQYEPAVPPRPPASSPGERLRITSLADVQGMLFMPLNATALQLPAGDPAKTDGSGGAWMVGSPTPAPYDVFVGEDWRQAGMICNTLTEAEHTRCLIVPPEIDPRVRQLAGSIASAAHDPLDKAHAIESYLQTHFTYSLTIHPGPGDPVSNFLLRRLPAHCEYFAAGAVMLLRCSGIPARYVVGYYAHEFAGDGLTIVRQRDAHAWAEAWIDGIGWVTIDGTPGSGLPDQEAAAEPPLQKLVEWCQDHEDLLRLWLGRHGMTFAPAAGAAVALFGLALLIRRRNAARMPVTAARFRYAEGPAHLDSLARRFEAYLRRSGRPCPSERPWDEHLAAVPGGVDLGTAREFVAAYNYCRFGDHSDPEALTELNRLLRQLEEDAALSGETMIETTAAHLHRVEANLAQVIRGKPESIRLVLIAIAAGGHVLLEDVPGTGKTTLAKSLARSISGVFRRIQFTPDLLPADIIGSSFYNPRDGTFEFRPGPIFANIVLADEINRTSPRTQSALLEVMSENQITIEGERRDLPQPFVVIATQNPTEFHGTYPLPEAQLDRFAVRVTLGYPDFSHELEILDSQHIRHPFDTLSPVVNCDDVIALQETVKTVRFERSVSEYLLRLVAATRSDPRLRLGVSPRGSLTLYRAAQARAWIDGRDFVLPEDVRTLAIPVLAHRLALDTKARYSGLLPEQVIQEALDKVPVPR